MTVINLSDLFMQQSPGDALFAVERALAMKDFSEFCRQAWPLVEPGRKLIWGWHLQAKCDHLQAVFRFTVPEEFLFAEEHDLPAIQDIIINEPPRCSKSLFTSVMFPAWVWTRWSGARFLNITYADDLAQRDALKCRNLIETDWYKLRWPGLFVDEDQRAKSRYNVGAFGGFRVSTTILGMATGEGGDFRIIDDPHNVKKALSDVERNQANTFYDLTLPTRVVDPKKSATIVCMQRLHQDDLTGHALDKESSDYDLLCLPMEYEEEAGNRCSTKLGFVDPRTVEGELLHPDRWDKKAVDKLKNELRSYFGEFGISSQLQQRPTPLGGGMFKPDNLILVPKWPPVEDLERAVRYWDKGASEGTGAYTAGALLARRKSTQRTIILDVKRGQWATETREMLIKETAFQDRRILGGTRYAVRVEQEPGSGGKDSAIWTVKGLAGFDAGRVPKTTSKEVDWAPLAAQVNLGGVEMVVGPWNKALTDEMRAAPFGKYKDQLDACSGGFKHIWLGPVARVLG